MAGLKAAPFRFCPFSRKQAQALTWWRVDGVKDHDGLIGDGSVRSGKTICMGTSFFLWSMSSFSGQNFAICGRSIGAVRRNVVEPLKQILTGRGYTYRDHRAGTDQRLEVSRGGRTNTYYLFGGKDESSYTLIQGVTLAGVFLDEVALMPRSFVEQACARCSVAGSKLWFNCNPAGPSHWFKENWLDLAEEKNLIHLHFTMDDNLSLSEEIKNRYKSMYTGVFYRRYILGEWCVAEGIIYPMYEDALEDRYDGPATDYALSIDYGTQNAFAALLWKKDPLGVWHMTDEYRYSGRDTGIQKTDEEYADELEKLLVRALPEEVLQRLRDDFGIETIVDPSAASFIATLRRRGLYRVRKAKNDVLDGIRDTATCLLEGKVKIARTAAGIVKEFGGYVWDDKPGEERPVKVEDHSMDALRYMVETKRLVKPVEDYKSPFRRRV